MTIYKQNILPIVAYRSVQLSPLELNDALGGSERSTELTKQIRQ
jgi:hypothetical protein